MLVKILLLLILLWPLFAAIFPFLLKSWWIKKGNLLFMGILLIEMLFLVLLFLMNPTGLPYSLVLTSFAALSLSFELDGFRLVLLLLTLLLFTSTTLCSKEYLQGEVRTLRYASCLSLTLGAVLGVFLSNDLFTTFLFFELMSFSSFALVLQKETKESFQAAKTYLSFSLLGGIVLLFGLMILYSRTNTLTFDSLSLLCEELFLSGTKTDQSALFLSGCLMLFGFGIKSCIFPLHVWLPDTYKAAPTPAAALFSGLLTKTGIFGIFVLTSCLFAFYQPFMMILLILGLITMFVGGILALFSTDLIHTLAYSSMSQIGFLILGIAMCGVLGQDAILAFYGTLIHLINHALVKQTLFLSANVVTKEAGSSKLNQIRGIGNRNPVLFFSFLMGMLGISGLPLWNGYLSKTLLHESILEYIHVTGQAGFQVVEWLFLIAGGLTFAYMMKLMYALFTEPKKKRKKMKLILSKQTSFTLAGTALLLPLFGMLPSFTLEKAAFLSTDFWNTLFLEKNIVYFSGENFSSVVWTVFFGLIFYFALVKKLVLKRARNGKLEFVERMSEKWSLLRIYRFFLRFFSDFFGKISIFFDNMLEFFICFLQRTALRPLHKETREPFLHMLSRRAEKYKNTNKMIESSMSFGLMMIFVGLCFTLIYLLSNLL